jgi:hypothetical protein
MRGSGVQRPSNVPTWNVDLTAGLLVDVSNKTLEELFKLR